MHPLVGTSLRGATLTPFDDSRGSSGALGRPVWSPLELLEDLELCSGIVAAQENSALRTACWLARMRAHGERPQYYSASLRVDPWGTAAALLRLRDTLVEAGWLGQCLAGGGARLRALAELEALASPALPAGVADRLAALARALERRTPKRYEALTLTEPNDQWPGGWQRVFALLERAGTRVNGLKVALPGAPPESDLGKLQRALSSETPRQKVALTGDGSLLRVTAETALEGARAAAALLAQEDAARCVVIREQDVASLEYGLAAQGLPSQGSRAASSWRAALQVLPLAIELAFEPKVPHRVWDLLCLPRGPFAGSVGRRLLGALRSAPGIGSRDWEQAKRELPEPRESALQRIAEWFERPGAPRSGAKRSFVLSVIERVREWLSGQVPLAPDDSTLRLAVHQCQALREAMATDASEAFDLVSLRRLLRAVSDPGGGVERSPEGAGRYAHVASPHALWAPRETVLWWPFTAQEEPRQVTWRVRERAALAAAGVRLADYRSALLARAESFRRCAWAASERLLLLVPRTLEGQPLGTHPLWDEAVARAGLSEADCARITCRATELLTLPRAPGPRSGVASELRPRAAGPRAGVASELLAPLPLPRANRTWNVRLSRDFVPASWSAASLGTLLGCPLAWALRYLAGIRSEDWGLPAQHLLNGQLGHRLIEQLCLRRAFELPNEEFDATVEQELSTLLAAEGAPLLRPGKAHERAQLRRLLLRAATSLRQALRDNGLSVVGVEQAFELPWRGRRLEGRWDLVAETPEGRRLIIDIKWGRKRYDSELRAGASLQLATYLHASAGAQQRACGAVFYSLSAAQLFGHGSSAAPSLAEVPGPSLQETWKRVERTLPLLEACLSRGHLPVTGVAGAEPLLDALGVTEPEQAAHFAVEPAKSCEYCHFDGLCGKRWENGP